MPNSSGATRAPAPGARSRSNSTALVVGLSVLLCIAAIAYLAYRGGGGSSEPTAAHATPAPGTCNQPPSTPSTASTYASAPDPSLAQASTWTATISTNCGNITLQLYGDKAPQTVASFVFLAQHGYWKDSPCHRLTTSGIFVLQCGDPTGSGSGDPGYQYGIENAPPNGSYPVGTVAMARTSDPNSNGGQFFLVYKNSRLPTVGGGYSIFGRVTGGMDIVQRIAKAGVAGGLTDGAPAQPISILNVSVRKG
jgi:peptidyl-prolyl cis-trans isomerase B (cyclophilin B)